MKDYSINNHREAVVTGLFLAITARTEEQLQKALQLTEELAACLTGPELAQAKIEALGRVQDESDGHDFSKN
jgi:hypothetical protein